MVSLEIHNDKLAEILSSPILYAMIRYDDNNYNDNNENMMPLELNMLTFVRRSKQDGFQ